MIPDDVDASNIDPASLKKVAELCRGFAARAGEVLDAAVRRPDYDELPASRDLYLVRAGHGTGFWDRKQLGDLVDRLTEIAGQGGVEPSLSDEDEITVDLW